MFLIIIWSLNVLLWFSELIAKMINKDKESTPGRLFFTFLWVLFCGIMLGLSINQYQEDKMFETLRIGQTYTSTFPDDPFTTKTITIQNTKDVRGINWLQYSDEDGVSHSVEMNREMYYFFKNR